MTTINKFIGSGITFPIELNSKRGPVVYNNTKLIECSIANILNWPMRMRWFNEEFGSRIEEILEEPDDTVSRTLLREFIREALRKWEKRIVVKDIITLPPKYLGRIDVSITYQIRNTKIEETIIYPFYKELIY